MTKFSFPNDPRTRALIRENRIKNSLAIWTKYIFKLAITLPNRCVIIFNEYSTNWTFNLSPHHPPFIFYFGFNNS